MAFNGLTSPGLSEAQVEQLFELRRRRAALTAEINRILGSVAEVDRPSWHCERCYHTWKGMWRNRKPKHCSHCHAANWDRPSPKKVNGAQSVDDWQPPWMRHKVTVEPLSGLTPPPSPLPIPDVAPFSTRFSQAVIPPQPESLIEIPDVNEQVEHTAEEVADAIEATQAKARAIAIETVMQEPQVCTSHRFVDGICLFCALVEPPHEEAT